MDIFQDKAKLNKSQKTITKCHYTIWLKSHSTNYKQNAPKMGAYKFLDNSWAKDTIMEL